MRLSQAPRAFVGKIGLSLAASALLVAPAALFGQEKGSATGTIKGRLVWAGAAIPVPKLEADAAKSKDAVCKVNPIYSKEITVDPATRGIANAFVFIPKPVGDYTAAEKALIEKSPEVVVDQVNCEFVPYVAVAHKDQKLVFKSSDPVGHNVNFQPFNNSKINSMVPPNGKLPYNIKEGERRPAKLECNIHPWMVGYVLITDNPLATVTKPDGSFEITGVPAGVQNVVIWQSKNGYVNAGGNKGVAVTVPAGGTVEIPEVKITTLK